MLRSLHIENIAVIRRADIDFSDGFSALTGETGAGKSLIIDSINLLLGNRGSRELIRTGETSATVSAVFDSLPDAVCERLREMGFACEDSSILLSRTLHADGKTQARLDGQSVTQTVLREAARTLVSIHGQSDNQKLLQKSSHGELLDSTLPPDALAPYAATYAKLKETRRALAEVSRDDAERLRRQEMLRYQIEDIDSVKLRDGEEEALTKERDRLANAEKIDRAVETACRALTGGEKHSAYDLIRRAQNAMQAMGGVVDGIEELLSRLETAASEVMDVSELISGYADDDREDPTVRIDRVEGRLDVISKLKRKYGNSVAEILRFREMAQTELDRLDHSDEERETLEKRERELTGEAKRLAADLTARRLAAAREIERAVTESLTFLDMPKVRFSVSVTPTELSERGADDIEFLIASNVGEPLLPMIKIASGGELSRIMLALRSVLNDRDGATTVIFDEVDAGVSGKTARKIGIKLQKTAKAVQVLCVTHSAQIASLADTQYRIAKSERNGRAETDVTELSHDERVEEIARILGGIEVTETQRASARELLDETF